MRALAVVVGSVLVLVSAADALNTLVSTRLREGSRWPADWFYRITWAGVRSVGLRIRDENRQEGFLSLYGPLSVLGLLVTWVVTQVLGWALVWWGLAIEIRTIDSLTDAIYYAGVGYLTIGFGDIVPVDGPARLLALLEGLLGVGMVALVIGYLPTLYGAYSQREQQLLRLDDLTGDRITPVALVEAYTPDGNVAELYAFFDRWEGWTAQVLESHTSLPMLVYFRSQHRGQSWVTGLGVVLDAAVLVMATVEDPRHREAQLLYRRASRTFVALARRLGLDTARGPTLNEEFFRVAYDRLEASGLALRPFDLAWVDLQALRAPYTGALEALIDHLAAPRGFWGHSVDVPDLDVTASPADHIWGPERAPRADVPPEAGDAGPDATDLAPRRDDDADGHR